MMDFDWGGAKVILFNYGSCQSMMWPRQTGRISFFWKGVLSCLPALRGCFSYEVITGKETFFWKDGWLGGCASMNWWPEEFHASHYPNGTVHELIHLLDERPFVSNEFISQIRARMRNVDHSLVDKKR